MHPKTTPSYLAFGSSLVRPLIQCQQPPTSSMAPRLWMHVKLLDIFRDPSEELAGSILAGHSQEGCPGQHHTAQVQTDALHSNPHTRPLSPSTRARVRRANLSAASGSPGKQGPSGGEHEPKGQRLRSRTRADTTTAKRSSCRGQDSMQP